MATRSKLLVAGGAVLAGLIVVPAAQAVVVITPAPGFVIGYDGNDGANFNAANPAPVPANLANAAGSTAFGSSELDFGVHFIPNVNNGTYGNNSSWIARDGDTNPNIGVALGTAAADVTRFAFGRDNGNNVADACGGQCTDRWNGIYTIQVTEVASPGTGTPVTNNAATGWETVGTFDYVSSEDEVTGGLFTGYFRHEYTVSRSGGPLPATALRILVPRAGAGNDGNAIDEIEVYGTPVPEPTALSAFGLAGLLLARRRR